ncbi:1266_t:CDS:1, partial [Funneliformis mosseae]
FKTKRTATTITLGFSNRHKENLEFHLRQFLTDNLVSNNISSSNSNIINTFQPNTTVHQPQTRRKFF